MSASNIVQLTIVIAKGQEKQPVRAKTSEFDTANFSFGIDQHNRWARQSRSGEQRLDHMSMDIGQSSINAIVTDGQSLVIDAQ